MELPIKLGRKSDLSGPIAVEPSKEPEEIFPVVYLEWEKPYSLPDGEFTMTVRARTIRSTEDKKREKFNEDVEILEIVSVKPREKKKKDSREEAGDALDKLKDEAEYEDS